MNKPKAMIICGDGINCDAETGWGLELAGFEPMPVHSSDFLEQPGMMHRAQLVAIPGGFSFGDEIASGKVLAVKLKKKLKEALYEYIEAGKLVIGICNGFQVLTQLGLLPNSHHDAPRLVSLTRNSGGKFINRWVQLEVSKENPSPFFRSLDRIELPIRHGEGRLALPYGARLDTVDLVKQHACLRYSNDINGSFDRIAALSNSRGNVLGLMPHPEAFVRWTQHPSWTEGLVQKGKPHGLVILENAYRITHG